MPYRIAGIDVHKKMLAVVVADVEVDGEYQFERRKVGTSPADLRDAGRVARRARSRGSRDGIDRAVLAAGVGSAGAVLAAAAPGGRGRRADVGHAASGAGAVESGPRRTEEGFPGCRTIGEAAGRPGADVEFCARRRAAALADRDAAQVSGDAQSRPAAEPAGSAARRSAHQALESGLRSAGHQRPPHAAGDRGWRDRSGDAGGAGGLPRLRATPDQLCDALRCVSDAASGLPSAAEADAGRAARDRGAPRRSSIRRWPTCSPTIRTAVQRLAEVPGLGRRFRAADHRRSRRRPRPPSPHPSTSPRGWAPVPATRRAPA